VGALLLTTSCHEPEGEKRPEKAEPLRVRAARVARRDLAEAVELVGTLAPLPGRDVKLGTLVAGRLAEVRGQEGDRVAAHQLLALLEPGPLRDLKVQAEAAQAQAQAAAQLAALKQDRAEKAVAAGVAPAQDLDDARASALTAQAALRSAEAALHTAAHQLEWSELRAPFAGVIVHVFATAGEPVDASGKPVIEVADMRALELRGGVTPAQAARLSPGLQAQLLTDGAPLPATVVAVSPGIDPATGLAGVRLRADNPGERLRAGATLRARIQLGGHAGVLTVPRAALVPFEQGESAAHDTPDGGADPAGRLAVERIDDDGAVHRVAVEVGASEGDVVEVTGALAAGQRVVTQGAYALPDGTKVTPELER
jgi:RND family efflux transporter MFP subunit